MVNADAALRGIALLLGVDPTGKSIDTFLAECAALGSAGGASATAFRVLLSDASSGTITHSSIKTTSVISVTVESVGSEVAQVCIDGPVSDGSFDVLVSGQDNQPYLHVLVVN